MSKKKTRIPLGEAPGQGFNTALSRLAAVAPVPAPQSASPEPPPAAPPSPAPVDAVDPRRLRVRCERKGRGGKTVTIISHATTSLGALEDLASQLRRGLGCGARVEGDEVVLQGDQRERVQSLLGLTKPT